MPRRVGGASEALEQEEQQRRDRAPDDAGGFSDLEKLSKKLP